MEFSILTTRSADGDDGRLYPIPTADGNGVRIENWDGETHRLIARGVEVSELVAGDLTTRHRVKGGEVGVIITDSRLAVVCSKHAEDSGWPGFWIGGPVTIGYNALSKPGATHRRRRKAIVGQVRYPWLRCVGSRAKTSWRSTEEIRLGIVAKTRDGMAREIFLDVALPKEVNSADVARWVATKAARYRLAYGEIENEACRSQLEELAAGPTLAPSEPKKFAVYEMPLYAFVNAASAYPPPASGRQTP
jgi:hypothetical protein